MMAKVNLSITLDICNLIFLLHYSPPKANLFQLSEAQYFTDNELPTSGQSCVP